MERGYVKLWRKTLDSGLLQHPAAWQLFGYLLLKATRKAHRQIVGGVIFDLSPGEVVFSRAKAAAELCLSEQQIRTALGMLKKLKIATSASTSRCTIISIVNWDRYQDSTPADQPADQPAEQPTSNQHLTSPLKKQERKNIYIPTLTTFEWVSKSELSDPEPPKSKEEKNPVVELTDEEHDAPGKQPACPQKTVVEAYHEILPELPRVRVWRANNATALRTRWREKWKEGKFADANGGVGYFRRFFAYVQKSDFLMGRKTGRDGRCFVCTLAWMIQARHFDDILSGKYHDQDREAA